LKEYKANKDYFNPIEEEIKYAKYLTKGNNVWVYRGDTPDLCRIFGKNHKWCISSSNSASHWFSYRIDYHQTQYFVFDFNKEPNDPARYVNPGVAPEGMYSEWVDARNQHTQDTEDRISQIGINGYSSINQYKQYLVSKGIPLSTWKTTEPEDWEKRLQGYTDSRHFSAAKKDTDPRIFPLYLKIVENMDDENFDMLEDEQKKEFVMSKLEDLTDKQFEYAKTTKGYVNSLSVDDRFTFGISTGNVNVIEEAVKKGATIRDDAVYNAAKNGHLDIVKYLVEKGAKIENLAVYNAASNGHFEIVKYLVEQGAKIGNNAVYYAPSYGHLDIVKYLVEKGAKIGNLAVYYAPSYGHLDIVKYLVEKGAKIGNLAVARQPQMVI
jgi:hypothetical protein